MVYVSVLDKALVMRAADKSPPTYCRVFLFTFWDGPIPQPASCDLGRFPERAIPSNPGRNRLPGRQAIGSREASPGTGHRPPTSSFPGHAGGFEKDCRAAQEPHFPSIPTVQVGGREGFRNKSQVVTSERIASSTCPRCQHLARETPREINGCKTLSCGCHSLPRRSALSVRVSLA